MSLLRPLSPLQSPSPPRRFVRLLASLCALGLLFSGQGCRQGAGPQAGPTPEARRQQQQQALARCQQQRRQLQAGLEELRQVEARVVTMRRKAEVGARDPQPQWDEEKEQRFSQVDQQLDRQRYEQELAAWQQRREASGVPDPEELAAAQQRLDQLSRQLHQRYPRLFSGPESIELRPQELERLNRCPRPAA